MEPHLGQHVVPSADGHHFHVKQLGTWPRKEKAVAFKQLMHANDVLQNFPGHTQEPFKPLWLRFQHQACVEAKPFG